MYPPPCKTRAISTASREAGSETRAWAEALALRIRVSMSAIVSVLILSSPRSFLDAGDLTPRRQRSEADPADTELADVGARPATILASAVGLHRVLGLAQAPGYNGLLRHVALSSLTFGTGIPVRSAGHGPPRR